jgi:hypothetical protein
MFCSDPYLNLLKEFGYNVVRLPKADIKPLQLFAQRRKDLDRLGDLTTILVARDESSLPPVSMDQRAANVSGQRTSDLRIGLGLSVLGSLIGAMGGSTLGLDVAYQQARSAAFEFHDVLEDRVTVAELDQYLAQADINPASRYLGELLEADELITTTATIKSTKFVVEAKRSDGGSLAVNVPEVQGVVGAEVKVSGQGDAATKVTYEGSTPLVFGFQAVRLYYDRGRYTAFEPLEGLGVKALPESFDEGVTPFVTDGPFVRVASL